MKEYNIDVIRKKYQVVPRTLIFIEKEDKLLMLSKTKKDSFGYGKINGVGGHIEQGEEPFESARREIMEEAGIEVKELEMAAVIFIDINATPGILVFVFKAAYAGGELRNSEEGLLQWMTREQIRDNQNMVKDLPFLLDVVDKHKTGTPPLMIKYLYDKNEELRIVI